VKIVAVGSPKGGVGKTVTAVTVAAVAAADGARVLLVDCDDNRSALDWCADSGDCIPVDVSDGRDLTVLRQLRQARGYDLAVVDLPGARVGAFQAILAGSDGRPVADLLVVPTSPELMDLRPVIRVVRGEVAPLGLVHLLVLTRVDPLAMNRAQDRQAELRIDYRLAVADVVVRDYVVYREALERSRTVLDIGGRRSYARRAEQDYRALTAEILAVLGASDRQHQPQEV
jgi:chromosome partitioning protein